MNNYLQVSIVVIGYNEAQNLDVTFQAINKINFPKEEIEVIYVDSASTDQSVEIAKKYADKVYIEQSSYPTAARGRNKGLIEARGEIVHFVDGDVEITPNYLIEAVKVLLENDKIAAVTGEIIEKKVKINFLNRVFSASWEESGERFVKQTKAGGTYKKDILLKINGYDERVKLGEETELGERIINHGYNILQINEVMGLHDYDFNGFKSLVELYIKDGEAKIIQSLLNERSNYFSKVKKLSFSNLVQNIIFFFLIIIGLFLGEYCVILLGFLLYFVLIAIKYGIKFKEMNKYRLLYYLIMNSMKPFTFWGQIKMIMKLLLNRDLRSNVRIPKMILKPF